MTKVSFREATAETLFGLLAIGSGVALWRGRRWEKLLGDALVVSGVIRPAIQWYRCAQSETNPFAHYTIEQAMQAWAIDAEKHEVEVITFLTHQSNVKEAIERCELREFLVKLSKTRSLPDKISSGL